MRWTRISDKPVRLGSFDLWPECRAFVHGYMENTSVDGVELGDDISQSRATAGLRKKVRVLATGCTHTVARARLGHGMAGDYNSLAGMGE